MLQAENYVRASYGIHNIFSHCHLYVYISRAFKNKSEVMSILCEALGLK